MCIRDRNRRLNEISVEGGSSHGLAKPTQHLPKPPSRAAIKVFGFAVVPCCCLKKEEES